MSSNGFPEKQGLYDPSFEHDSCGVGFIASMHGTKSHQMIQDGLKILTRLEHRGATGSDPETGDGAGILVQIPDAFFRKVCTKDKINLPAAGEYGAGLVFLPQDKKERKIVEGWTKEMVEVEGQVLLGWRDVPHDDNFVGKVARSAQPIIRQVFIGRGESTPVYDFAKKLYLIRKQLDNKILFSDLKQKEYCYFCSLSHKIVVYKGQLMSCQLEGFYPDLKDPDFVSALALVHSRYSTNTFPSWKLAQPFRLLAHNGEINTLRGNINQIQGRERFLQSDVFSEDLKKLFPVIDVNGSDSACLDNALELLVECGRDLSHAMMMMVPQAWGEKYPIGPDLKGFFEYHAGMMEPWDGPAAVSFTNGFQIGAVLDRNGLRPARYAVTKGGFVVFASEAGVLDLAPEDVVERGALRPGEMFLVDLEKQRLIKDKEIKTYVARRQPYRRWVEENKITLHGVFNDVEPVLPDIEKMFFRHKLFGYSLEDLKMILGPMASKGQEPIGSMGNDSPLAIFSDKPQLLFSYFKQLFAQITNPAIDPIREELVMSLMTFIGNPGNILSEVPQNSRLIKLKTPILSNEDMESFRFLGLDDFRAETFQIAFPATGDKGALGGAVDQLCQSIEMAIKKGARIVILSDRVVPDYMIPIPSLLAVSAVNKHLVKKGLRTNVGLVVETGEAREVQHLVLLLGFGATAINPYLAFETVADMANRGALDPEVGVDRAVANYIKALCKGLLKVMSKMGISTLRSYRGAQVFEAVGLNQEVIEKYFTGTASRIEGIGLEEIAAEAKMRYDAAYENLPVKTKILPDGGQYAYRKDGERHLWTPESISKLQYATRANDYQLYKEYTHLIDDQSRRLSTLRGMFRFKKTKLISVNKVEPAEEIMKRFVTSAMSFGSISREAHETMAIAMNRIGGKSNSGEGGEDPGRYKPLPNGDSRNSAVKQVASGRFGVSAEYLVNCKEIQIKIAQGAKPGEGGQLPGHKVNEEIARIRYSTPGVTLISPPPHHDIYSIEDIKQLIFDLKNVNPQGRVSVKLVSEAGVGTIAAGVAKARADMVLISGYDGGTGASPLSSIKHTGAPWELGIAETQQTLVLNKLRSRIRVQADGQMKTGRDIIVAALLGAEEFGFGTVPLVLCGCVMMRKCHLNTCPVGVATQDPQLRKFFTGKPEYIVNFFKMIAQEIREYMAELGVSKIDDLVGRTDFLEVDDSIDFWKAKGLDFSRIFCRFDENGKLPVRCTEKQDHGIDDILDRKLIELSKEALEKKKRIEIDLSIQNVNLSTGAMLSGEVARLHGGKGLPDDTILCNFEGAAGQSFAAFGMKGITFALNGEANDYLGKGLCGAKVIVNPQRKSPFNPSENIICGNVLLYGATSGELYVHGKVGERFAIRNSGVTAVVEGVGDHGCEYMTGGRVVVLGETGVNFAAGMSGGIAYIYDPENKLDQRCNLSMVDLELIQDVNDICELKNLIQKYLGYTKSIKAKWILDNWDEALPSFVKVFPMEYRRVLGKMMKEDEETEREEVENK
ncbi:MAG: glutamate synthase large subunit [Candidatus Omnitrophica bacterium]|nr:glutamate synthase large subunit [Candidatus Omnitrophota bacterium]